MKTKNVILGICAFIFAFGSAFTSSRPPVQYKIQVDKGGLGCTQQSMVCVDISNEEVCDGSGANCTVEVNSSQLSASPAFAITRDETCQTLSNSSDEPVATLSDNCITGVY
jgi:hypothetical protein